MNRTFQAWDNVNRPYTPAEEAQYEAGEPARVKSARGELDGQIDYQLAKVLSGVYDSGTGKAYNLYANLAMWIDLKNQVKEGLESFPQTIPAIDVSDGSRDTHTFQNLGTWNPWVARMDSVAKVKKRAHTKLGRKIAKSTATTVAALEAEIHATSEWQELFG